MPKENEPKERAPHHLSAFGRYPEFMPRRGAPQNGQALRNSLRSDSPRAFLAVSAVLRYVKRVKSLAPFRGKSNPRPLGVDALLF
jgi:hypothetical protein